MTYLTQFIEATDSLVRFESNFKTENQTVSSLKIFRNRLQHLWECVESAYETYRSAIPEQREEDLLSEISAMEQKHECVFTTYALLLGNMDTLIDSMSTAGTPTVIPQPPVATGTMSVSHTNNLDLLQDPLLNPIASTSHQAITSTVIPPISRANMAGDFLVPVPNISHARIQIDNKSQANFPNTELPLFSHNSRSGNFCSTPLNYRSEEYVTHNTKVPCCDIEPFHGSYLAWPTFRDLFTALYIRNGSLSNIERLFHLIAKTKGEANEIVTKVQFTSDGFTLAWRNLEKAYENQRVLYNSQMKKLYGLPAFKKESVSALQELQRGVNSYLESLTLFKLSTENLDGSLVFMCSQRLPETTLELWEQSLENKRVIPKWSQLDDFLSTRIMTLQSISDVDHLSVVSPKPASGSPTHSQKMHYAQIEKTDKPLQLKPKGASTVCSLCSRQKHSIRACPQFRAMTVADKWNQVKRLHLCHNCLSDSHTLSECHSSFNCANCHQRHHTFLHEFRVPVPNRSNEAMSQDAIKPDLQASTNTQMYHQRSLSSIPDQAGGHCVLLGTANLLLHHNNDTFKVRALIDSGSEVSCISQSIRNRLNLPSQQTKVALKGINEQITAEASARCMLRISSMLDQSTILECSALVLPRISGNLPNITIPSLRLHRVPVQLADETFYESSSIDMLIGGDLYPLIIRPGVKSNVLGSLLAQETVFGWILTGSTKTASQTSYTATVHLTTTDLSTQLRNFWELEEIPAKKYLTPSERFCEDLYRTTTKRNSDGRYIVTLPFKQEYDEATDLLGSSRNTVATIFRRNEGVLLRKPEFKIVYDKVLNEYIDLGHMTPVSFSTGHNHHYYLPHHPVLKPESTTTSVRVVFNASHCSSNGRSLNDVLHPGPALQADLTTMLLKWRMARYVFSSDITKMYRQILVNPNQTKFQRILFRPSPHQDILDYELKTVTFGVNCAPFLAIRTLLQLAHDVQASHPLAAKILRRHMYVDDVLAGYDDIPSALRARDELIAALNSAGFQLRKWSSNSRAILEGLPADHLLNENFLVFEESSSSKALGVRWNAVRDEFFFSTPPISWKESFTKREVLSIIAKLFDPAGWLSPLVIVAKMIMQQIWLDGTDWDSALNPSTTARWKQFVDNYHIVEKIQIPRWVRLGHKDKVQLHGFCDASEKAYAAVLYVRAREGEFHYVHLLTAKTKVAPIKTVSLPRLELCGALLLSKMIVHVLTELSLTNYELHCWTDSTIVLAWLQKPPCSWKTFVASRVSQIQDAVGITCWRHVNGTENPADLGSRGTTSPDFITDPLWWNGPVWLAAKEDQWPKSDLSVMATNEEIKPSQTFLNVSSFSIENELERFSSYARLLRVFAYVYCFISATRRRRSLVSLSLTAAEIQNSKMGLIRAVQSSHFSVEIKDLQTVKQISRQSILYSLNPVLDEMGILRVQGRLTNSDNLSLSEKLPLILPYHSRLTRLLVLFMHLTSLHGGNRLMLRLLRQEIWVPKAQNLIKAIINQCKTCAIFKHKLQTQIMAALPKDRSTWSRPFTVTGVDFAGPFDIKHYSGRTCRITKGYVCVFVCFATKAIHLEVTSSLTTECFLACFARFVARRGCPRKMYSDNGTTFHGASSCLRKEMRQVLHSSQESAHTHYLMQNLSWEFIPAGAPHMGGLWEAGVKSFKTHFRKVASGFRYTFEEMSTVLCRIEACLNSRPLCPSSGYASDFTALTPGHFLIGAPLLSPAEMVYDEQPISVINRWQKLKALTQAFATQWKEEYLKELHKRTKWKNPNRNLAIDDLVVIRKENVPPTVWPLGRVQMLHPGNDGLVRVVTLRTSKGLVVRPITKMSSNGDNISMSLEESDIPSLMLDSSPVKSAESNSPADLDPVATIVTPDYRCKVCQKGHPLRHCKRFHKMPVLQRLRTVVKYRYYARCLALSHMTAECASERQCHVCGKDHHSLLHENEVRRGPRQTASLRVSGVQSRTAKTAGGIDRPRLVKPTIRCYALVGPRKVAVRVLLDLCANDNLVNVNLGPSLDQRLAVGQKVTLTLTSYHDLTVRLIVTATGVNNLGGVTPELPVPDAVVNRFNHFKLADSTFNVPSPPQVILCAAVYAQLVCPGFFVQPGLPVAQETIFGYMLTGSFV